MKIKIMMKSDESDFNTKVTFSQVDDATFEISIARVGAAEVKKSSPMTVWDAMSRKYEKKGFVDVTTNFNFQTETSESGDKYAPIKEKKVARLIKYLRHRVAKALHKCYSVTATSVSPKAISEAWMLIEKLKTEDLEAFNGVLKELFVKIPRKMDNVRENLAKSEQDFPEIIQRETDLLKNLETEVIQSKKTFKTTKATVDVLEANGLEVRPVTDGEKEEIISHLGKESAHLYRQAFCVVNHRTEKAYEEYKQKNGIQKDRLFYHGSRTENFWSIISQGLSLNPNAPITGKMFGYGLYFAPRAKKSINYTSLNGSVWAKGKSDTGFLAIYKLAYKNAMHVDDHRPSYSAMTEKEIRHKGYDCLYAHAGKALLNDEVIVYNEAQTTIKYLVELGD